MLLYPVNSPVDMVNIPLFTGIHTCQVGFLAGFLNHQRRIIFQAPRRNFGVLKETDGHLGKVQTAKCRRSKFSFWSNTNP